MHQAKITSKGQVTIPADVRAKLRLGVGDRVYFEEMPDGSYRMRAKTGDIRRLKGIVPRPSKPVSIEDMNEAVIQAAVDRYKRSFS